MPLRPNRPSSGFKNIGILNFLRKILVAVLLPVLSANLSFAAERTFKVPGFTHPFRVTTERNQPGGFAMVKDPLDQYNAAKVFKFSINPGPCVQDDCEQQSARATVQQGRKAKQPKEAWYGWDMYFVPDFPIGSKQVRGHQIFVEFKDQDQCQLVALTTNPHSNDQFLSWSMEKPSGKQMTQFGGDCINLFDMRVASIRELAGAWHRFELFVRWTREGDGRFLMFLDGKQVVDYHGVTCFSCDKLNYFLFGNYLCCTTGTKLVVPATVYYRYVSMAKSREALVWK
ncbi:hypothetical protein CO660_03595 [Rhizobium sp. L9]|uniref:heparin lyase I family protein n=1 Tax=Rhizobium sp. L9 TaxID=1340738 RepID=UPI000BEA64C1|nr:heparin lyase I family protein [Rhizobium sp. L9]PDT31134.1 hypothetical protein CO660_03595 [Rhizobium sp. L9]